MKNMKSQPQPRATLALLLLAIGLVMPAGGLPQSLLQVRSERLGMPADIFGAVMAGYYVGLLAGSLVAPAALRRFGHRQVFIGLAVIGAGAVLLPVFSAAPPIWALARFLTGLCFAGFYVATESWLNLAVANDRRGQIMALYMTVQFSALALAQAGLGFFDPLGSAAFAIASLFFLLAIPVVFGLPPAPKPPETQRIAPLQLWRAATSGLVLFLLIGFAQGGFWAMAARWAAGLGIAKNEIGWMMGAATIGAGLAQWPLGHLSDLWGRERVMRGALAVAILSATALAALGGTPEFRFALPILAGLYGAGALTLYSLGNAWVNDRLSPAIMIGAGGALVLIYGLGAILGTMLAGQAIARLGPAAFMIGLGLVHLVMLIVLHRPPLESSRPRQDRLPY